MDNNAIDTFLSISYFIVVWSFWSGLHKGHLKMHFAMQCIFY